MIYVMMGCQPVFALILKKQYVYSSSWLILSKVLA